jgi:Na+/H+ antiporter NhaD/arsenite permease-like protein
LSFVPGTHFTNLSIATWIMITAIIVVFVLGYLAIALEHQLHINKAASALLVGGICWALYAIDVSNLVAIDQIPSWFVEEAKGEQVENVAQHFLVEGQLLGLTGEIAGILFFLMGAMTIVELVDAHEGFALITNRIHSRNRVKLLWIICWLTFFLSSILDNLTTTIVMISLVSRLVHDRETRLMFAGFVVIAANAGGAWTVIGDVTTTMLWIKHKIGTVEVMQDVFAASFASLLVPLIGVSFLMRGELAASTESESKIESGIKPWQQRVMLFAGVFGLLFVPAFKAYTHLPPFIGMILSLGVLWVISEFISHTMDDRTKSSTGVLAALKRVDMSSVLFFLGILLAVGSLGKIGILQQLAHQLDSTVGNADIVAVLIGLVSAVVDNVPLVAAGIEMYDLPMNDQFWMFLAFCAGTGGSCLVIGSAAGVAAMGIEQINFIWYLRRITPWALIGYFSGVVVFLVQAWLVK